jgi:hypothetical protein
MFSISCPRVLVRKQYPLILNTGFFLQVQRKKLQFLKASNVNFCAIGKYFIIFGKFVKMSHLLAYAKMMHIKKFAKRAYMTSSICFLLCR